ncbi:unnamed protein product [Cylindrotheca closterium]|uniref:Protein kinase domain-containing protein n=1 Tax=Cylindrotheca closterium TaxID=2856 RepID=A0AAD2CFS2_9STRA|nr:unnamed protein product [Cylindrotheca closterium]
MMMIRHISKPTTIIFKHPFDSNTSPLVYPPQLLYLQDDEAPASDYENSNIIDLLQDDETHDRQRDNMDHVKDSRETQSSDVDDDHVSAYYAFDDDAIKGGQTETEEPCRRISEHRNDFQNCNNFHEQHLLEGGIKFLGEGAFREVFGLSHPFREPNEQFVLKELRFDEDINDENSEFIRMDAAVAERLSASPRTFDIYGFCGVGILSEYFFHGDIEEVAYEDEGEVSEDLREIEEFEVQTNLTGREKVVLALEMAEGIALLHGNAGGVIVHDDIQLSQFLLNKDKTMLKINDFNRAEYMLYDESKETYCKYHNGGGNGNWRAPEEYKNEGLNEKIDVWSLGNNMYTLLTGLDPFPWLHSKEMQVRESNHRFFRSLYRWLNICVYPPVLGYCSHWCIDPRFWARSKEEGRLAEIIKQCFEYNPDLRPSVFDIVEQLREVVTESLGDENVTRAQVLQGLSD